ncbi:MAG: UPF0175 family protein [Candidatus Altiarchaeota archaeon]|nr:UPF0175 family protein [Candidatus Altiarchaeota archaeon]
MSEGVFIKIPSKLKEEADLYVESGYFENRSELIREAVREFLEKLDKRKTELAIGLYRQGRISLGRAAEISGLGYENMKGLLLERGIRIRRGPESIEDLSGEYDAAKDI